MTVERGIGALACGIGGLTLLTGSVGAADPAFSDQTVSTQVIAEHDPAYFDSFLAGGTVGDFNDDGYQDIFIATGGGGPDRLFINNGNGTFTDRADEWGVDLTHRSTAATAGDYNGDGRLDLFVTSLGPAGNNAVGQHKLYRNDGTAFVDRAVQAGVNQTSQFQADGWGAAWGDYDLDGDLDLAVAGWNTNDGNRVFRNDGNGFMDVTNSIGLTGISGIVGFAPRFVDMDGDQDLVFFPHNDPIKVFRNDLSGADTNWIRIFLERGEATDITPNGIGSVVRVSFGSRTLMGRIDGGSNYLSQNELSAHFGLGGATMLDEVRVEWTNGEVTTLTDVAVNQTLTVAFEVCAEDLDGIGGVGVGDLLTLLGQWGPCTECDADFDDDGAVDVADLLNLLAVWGSCS